MTRFVSRRTLLKGLGAAAATPLVPLVGKAQERPPTRLVIFGSFSGMAAAYPDNWAPEGRGQSFTIRPESVLAPLGQLPEATRRKLLLVRGVDMLSTFDGPRPSGAHPGACANMLTGLPPLPGDRFTGGGGYESGWNGGASVDQIAAAALRGQTRFASLEAGVLVPREASVRTRMSYRDVAAPTAPENDRREMYRRVFADLGPPMADAARVEQRLRERRSVLDLVRTELNETRGELGASDRARLDAHLAAVRSLERRLDVVGTAPACDPAEEPQRVSVTSQSSVPIVTDLHLDLIVNAFKCDLTRVATLQWSGAPCHWRFDWTGEGLSAGMHSLSHRGASDGAAQRGMRTGLRWFASQVASLMERLDAIPEGEGTMLDNTVIVWATEVSKSNSHSTRDMPYVIAGGGAGRLRTGRSLHLGGVAHNQLLVSLLHAIGLNQIDEVGTSRYGRGPIESLLR